MSPEMRLKERKVRINREWTHNFGTADRYRSTVMTAWGEKFFPDRKENRPVIQDLRRKLLLDTKVHPSKLLAPAPHQGPHRYVCIKMLHTPCSTHTPGCKKINFVWICAHCCTNFQPAVKMCVPPRKLCHLSVPNYKVLKFTFIHRNMFP